MTQSIRSTIRTNPLFRMLTNLVLLTSSVLILAGCSTSPKGVATVSGVSDVVGTDLVGAQGASTADQQKIDRTVARLCGAKVWQVRQCADHGRLSREPRQVIKQPPAEMKQPPPVASGKSDRWRFPWARS